MTKPKQVTVGLITLLAMIAPLGNSHAESIEKILDQPFTAEFDGWHIRTIAKAIAQEFDLNIIIDNRAVPPVDGDFDADQFATDGIVGDVTAHDAPLFEVMNMITRPLGLRYTVEKSFIWISRADIIRHESFEDLETRYYDIGDRFVDDLNADRRSIPATAIDFVKLLEQAIPEIVEADASRTISFMRYFEDDGRLIVHTSPKHHVTIETLIGLLADEA